MQLAGHARFLELLISRRRNGRAGLVVVGDGQERRRRLLGDVIFVAPESRVDEHQKIGPGVEAIDRISGIGIGRARTSSPPEWPARPPRKTPSHLTRDGSMRHCSARRAPALHGGGRRPGRECRPCMATLLIGEPVLEYKPRDPLAREPASDVVALMVDRQIAVSAARQSRRPLRWPCPGVARRR